MIYASFWQHFRPVVCYLNINNNVCPPVLYLEWINDFEIRGIQENICVIYKSRNFSSLALKHAAKNRRFAS